ncbi:fibronectin type III domain-containing protein [Aquimarina sp. M1]
MKKHFIYSLALLAIVPGCEEILFEEDITDAVVILIAPSDGSQVENTSVSFSWNAVDQATSYRLQIAKPTFENAVQIVEDTTVTNTNFSVSLVKNEYEWRVRAQNSASQTTYTTAGFNVIESEDFSAREVLLSAPQNNLITNNTTVTLQWQPVTDAITYRIQLLNDNDQVIDESTSATNSIQGVFPEGIIRWQVRAENDTQSTLYFSRTLTVDTMNPLKPVATAPANQTTVTNTVVSFSWTRETLEGTTELDSIYVYRNEQLTDLATKDQVTSPADITLDASDTYYWFVKAFDEASNQSEASDTFSFTIN